MIRLTELNTCMSSLVSIFFKTCNNVEPRWKLSYPENEVKYHEQCLHTSYGSCCSQSWFCPPSVHDIVHGLKFFFFFKNKCAICLRYCLCLYYDNNANLMTGYNPRKLNFKYIIPERFHFLWPAMRKILPHRGRRREQMIIHINDKLSLTKVNYPFLYLMAGLRFNLWLRGGGL